MIYQAWRNWNINHLEQLMLVQFDGIKLWFLNLRIAVSLKIVELHGLAKAWLQNYTLEKYTQCVL